MTQHHIPLLGALVQLIQIFLKKPGRKRGMGCGSGLKACGLHVRQESECTVRWVWVCIEELGDRKVCGPHFNPLIFFHTSKMRVRERVREIGSLAAPLFFIGLSVNARSGVSFSTGHAQCWVMIRRLKGPSFNLWGKLLPLGFGEERVSPLPQAKR